MNLIAAAIIGIAIIVLLIAVCKVHPFLSLLAGSFAMAVCAGVEYDKAFDSFTSGVGSTIANVGLLIAFGSIIGTILFKCIKMKFMLSVILIRYNTEHTLSTCRQTAIHYIRQFAQTFLQFFHVRY